MPGVASSPTATPINTGTLPSDFPFASNRKREAAFLSIMIYGREPLSPDAAIQSATRAVAADRLASLSASVFTGCDGAGPDGCTCSAARAGTGTVSASPASARKTLIIAGGARHGTVAAPRERPTRE